MVSSIFVETAVGVYQPEGSQRRCVGCGAPCTCGGSDAHTPAEVCGSAAPHRPPRTSWAEPASPRAVGCAAAVSASVSRAPSPSLSFLSLRRGALPGDVASPTPQADGDGMSGSAGDGHRARQRTTAFPVAASVGEDPGDKRSERPPARGRYPRRGFTAEDAAALRAGEAAHALTRWARGKRRGKEGAPARGSPPAPLRECLSSRSSSTWGPGPRTRPSSKQDTGSQRATFLHLGWPGRA